MNDLLKAIQHGKPWIDNFNRVDYKQTFGQYCARFSASFEEELKKTVSLEELATGLVDAVESGWKKEHFWNKGAARINDKMMLVVYLTPMLLASGEELCHEFAKQLNLAWNNKFSENTYEIADLEAIEKGFTNKIMGFEFRG